MDKEQLNEAETKQNGIYVDRQNKKKILFWELTATVLLPRIDILREI